MSSLFDFFDCRVKRIDLEFRADNVDIETTIFKIKNSEYILYCEGNTQNLNIPLGDVEQTYTTNPLIKISTCYPNNYEKIIENIKDDEIAKNFEGVRFANYQIIYLLMGKFSCIASF